MSDIVSATFTAVSQNDPNNIPPQTVFTSTPATQTNPQLNVKPTDPNAIPGRDYFPPMGTVTGKLSYPSSFIFIPPLRIVFFSLANGSVSYSDTGVNQGTYSIDLPEGSYHVVAYPYSADAYTAPAAGSPTLAGGYTHAVACGLSVDCTDHLLIPVAVTARQTVNADPGDWYAPDGSFPPMLYP